MVSGPVKEGVNAESEWGGKGMGQAGAGSKKKQKAMF